MRADPIEAEKSIDELIEVTSEGLQEIRKSIHQITDENQIGILSDRLESLSEKFGRYTNTEITFHITGEESIYPESFNLVLIKCLQEALTNAKRHGIAAKIDITLHFDAKGIELTIQDHGKGAKKLQEGFGIKAMRQRISTLNGSFHIDSLVNRGTTIHCKIPVVGDI